MSKILWISTLLLVMGCGESSQGQSGTNSNNQSTTGNSQTGSNSNQQANNNWQKLEMRKFKDNNGQLLVEMPLPASWKSGTSAGPGQPSFTGPKNLQVIDYPLRSFMYNYDPSLAQVYYQSGTPMRQMPAVDALMQQDFAPMGKQEGLTMVNYYEIPEVASMDKWYTDQLYKALPTKTETKAIGINWKDRNGNPSFMLVHLNISSTAQMQNWYYMYTWLKADKDYVETAAKQLVFSLANAHYALEPIMTYNRQEMQRVGQNWAIFNKRMADNQAAFEANQRAHVNRTEAINNAIMSGYNQRMDAMDHNQEQFVDVIREKTNVTDPTTGQVYKVESHSNYYWMNNDGQYISTDKYGYNPNLDENMNNVKWQELNKVD